MATPVEAFTASDDLGPSDRRERVVDAILIQRENPGLQAERESRKLWGETAVLLLVVSLQRFKTCF